MNRKSYLVLLLPLLFLIVANGYAQDSYSISKKAPVILNDPDENLSFQGTQPFINKIGAATWVFVDDMANSFGPAISVLNPVAYDPASDVVALVHRGRSTYAQGSGEIWYNISTDRGVTWTRVAAINASGSIAGRYPNMAILNPTGGGISETSGLFSWPLLNPAAFGFLGAGVDQPLGSGNTFSVEDLGPPQYGSQVLCFTSDDWFLWESDNQVDNSVRVFRTQDFGVIEIIDDPNLNAAAFGAGGNICLGGAEHNGVVYLGFLGSMPQPNPIVSGWLPGYSKSTDNGATWSPIVIADFREIPALSAYDRIFDWKKGDAFVSYNGDINLDKDGYVHLIVPVTDTTTGPNVGNNALVEIFETATGWDGKVIFEGFDDNIWSGFWNSSDNNTGLGQMGPNGYLAMNEDRDILFSQWVAPPTPADTVFDIWSSWRKLDGEWSAPVNLTNTPDINEAGSHLAPMFYDDGQGNAKAFSMYWYENGVIGPVINTSNPADIFIAAVDFTYPVVSVDDDLFAIKFDLEQNYPNPFNPSTKINYTLAERSIVTLKVYDVLGNEVATIVNTTQEAGKHSVNFDASQLSSGLYIYTIKTGNFTSSRKMMLLK